MTLPIARSVLADARVLDGGEISLYDPNTARAEAMGRMIMKTPEYSGGNCRVTWDKGMEESLDGADIVRVGFPCGSEAEWRAGATICHTHGFCGSDMLSPTGSFLALKGGPIVLELARKMEKHCPQAWLAIFANPVAVYSGMVNNYTKIRALGICGGYRNHMSDLTRLMGRDEECPDYVVDVAGINHLSFIMRGSLHGRDIYELLGEHITPEWQPPEIHGNDVFRKNVLNAITTLVRLYREFGVVIFSTEGDGMGHLFDAWNPQDGPKTVSELDMNKFRSAADELRQTRKAENEAFSALLDKALDAEFWANEPKRNREFGRVDNDVITKIVRAKGGLGAQNIVTSRLNNGAVAGFTDRTVVEYSQVFDGEQVTPSSDDLAVPGPFHGLVSALAAHQTLLGDAIVSEDPRDLYHALYAYPVKQGSEASRAVYKALLEINKDEIPAAFQGLEHYLS
jgi:6-phospho-beta-glucosidase